MNKFLFFIFFIFSIPSISFALPKCGNTLHNCTGTYTWENGDEYDGDWKNNKMHGLGTYYYKKSGSKYDGDWKNNKMHGFGTFYWNDGDKYVGEWVNGKRAGEGVFTFANGKKQEGVFKDSKFLYAKKLKTNTIEKRLKAYGKELVNKSNKVKSKNNSKTTGYSKKWKWGESPLCRAVIRAAKTGDKVDWKLSVTNAKSYLRVYPESDVKDCFEKAKKIYASRDFTPKPEFIVLDSEEYNTKKDIGWNREYNNRQQNKKFKITRPAMKFIATNEKIYTGQTFLIGNFFENPLFKPKYAGLENLSLCRFKARYNLNKHFSKSKGKIEKVIIDFNKVDFNSQTSLKQYAWGFKFSCNGICHSIYEKQLFNDNIEWTNSNTLEIFTTRTDNMWNRVKSVLNDIKKICNKSTTKY